MRSLITACLALSLLSVFPPANANPIDEAARLVEQANMKRLHAQQTRPGVTIDAFRTDGCSGGLSDSWKTLARVWPEMARSVGNKPPWEHCCVAHDRDYWRGETLDGFEKRLQSDLRLRQCVEQTGSDKGADIAARLGVSEAEIVEIIDLTAEWMFYAVRIGGGPCSGLVWRWGHGWPRCGTSNGGEDGQFVRSAGDRNAFNAEPVRIRPVYRYPARIRARHERFASSQPG